MMTSLRQAKNFLAKCELVSDKSPVSFLIHNGVHCPTSYLHSHLSKKLANNITRKSFWVVPFFSGMSIYISLGISILRIIIIMSSSWSSRSCWHRGGLIWVPTKCERALFTIECWPVTKPLQKSKYIKIGFPLNLFRIGYYFYIQRLSQVAPV